MTRGGGRVPSLALEKKLPCLNGNNCSEGRERLQDIVGASEVCWPSGRLGGGKKRALVFWCSNGHSKLIMVTTRKKAIEVRVNDCTSTQADERWRETRA